ncbi:MAG: NADH-quinone oxidoreductase subunit C [Candidatus Omnitrophica bacterium]|nr:NADH-quinone oxidoreductase subunit C [Candidatus Omnitrophota bacterium]
MDREDVLKDIEERFSGDIVDISDRSPKRVYIEIKPDSLRKVARYVFRGLGARFNIASGVDMRYHMEILYHFTVEEIDLVISLRVKLDKDKPLEIDSIAPDMEAANWIEREIHEILGVDFKGHPDLRRLLLPDNWPEGVYPLRRDYEEWDNDAIRDRGIK